MTLSNKRMAFVNEYLVDFNATQAAIRAGYSTKGARVQGCNLLANPNIKESIKARLDEKAMSANEVLTRLAEHARGDIGDFLDISKVGFEVDLATAFEAGITHLIKKVKMHTVTTLSKDGVETETNTVEIELYDAQAALVQLGRYHKLFTDKTDVTSGGEKLELEIKGINYRTTIADLAPRSMGNSDSPGESESSLNGEKVG
jgi:phage terminase small subunit